MRIDRFSFFTLMSCFLMAFFVIGAHGVQADLFVTSQKKEQTQKTQGKGSFFSRIFGLSDWQAEEPQPVVSNRQKTAVQPYKRAAKNVTPIRTSAVEFYKSARNIDPALLRISGPGPQNVEELMQLAAALKTPQMASMLKYRRENREASYKAQQQYKRETARIRLLESRSAQSRSRSVSPPTGSDTEEKQATTRSGPRIFVPKERRNAPAKVFTDF